MEKSTIKIYEKVKKYITKYEMIFSGDNVLAGVSGGADSVCMLLMLSELSKELDFELSVVHVHHGVRADADADVDYVEKLCQNLEIPFFLKRVNMEEYARAGGFSPEEAGRQLRYQAFKEVGELLKKEEEIPKQQMQVVPQRNHKFAIAQKVHVGYKIAVAHNQNDRAETMLFHLFRGSGLRGLGSIRPVREQIIRPLLCLDRREIEAYLAGRNIAYCIDSTNEEDTYTRNRIRHHVLPFAEEQICKNAVSHINDAVDILTETENFIQKQTLLAYERCKDSSTENSDSVILDLTALQAEDPFLQKMILLQCMEELTPHRKDITGEHISALSELMYKDGSKELMLPYGLTVRKEYDKVVINKERNKNCTSQEKKQEYPPISVPLPGETEVPGLGILSFQFLKQEDFFYKKGQIIPEKTYTKWLDYDKITTSLLLRTRQTGDYLTINDALRRKTLKEYMINEKIPKMQRDSIYLLADGSHILWIPGYRISQYYKVNENTKCILQVQLRGGQ